MNDLAAAALIRAEREARDQADKLTVPFKMLDVIEYLDGVITSWREKLMRSHVDDAEHPTVICLVAIDSYQSVRKSLFGETLPPTPELDAWVDTQGILVKRDGELLEVAYEIIPKRAK